MKLTNNKCKCVVTITQNKRVALPFIFGKYILPRMREVFGGEIKLFHIFHNTHVDHIQLESNRDYGLTALDRVRYFIGNKWYGEATIIDHQEINLNHLILPSLIKCLEIAIAEQADYHLWMQDDAILFDKNCHMWQFLMKNHDIGLYRNTSHQKMINIAYFLSTLQFDEKLLPFLHSYVRNQEVDWTPYGSQMEHTFWKASQSQALFPSQFASRHHVGGKYASSCSDVKRWLRIMVPEITEEDLNLLNIDFPE